MFCIAIAASTVQPEAYVPASTPGPSGPIVLEPFARPEDLLERFTPSQLRDELARLGLKVGGTPFERARRLWATRGLPRDKWDPALFAGAPSQAALGRARAAAVRAR